MGAHIVSSNPTVETNLGKLIIWILPLVLIIGCEKKKSFTPITPPVSIECTVILQWITPTEFENGTLLPEGYLTYLDIYMHDNKDKPPILIIRISTPYIILWEMTIPVGVIWWFNATASGRNLGTEDLISTSKFSNWTSKTC